MMSKYAHKTARADYIIHVAIRFRQVRDTMKECKFRREEYRSYLNADTEPHFQVPAILHDVVFPWQDAGYNDMIYVNDNSVEDDPVLVACWDFDEIGYWFGRYQHCYIDVRVEWYRKHHAWAPDFTDLERL